MLLLYHGWNNKRVNKTVSDDTCNEKLLLVLDSFKFIVDNAIT